MREVYLVSGVRTAIGTFGGALKDVKPCDLATKVTAEALARSGVAAAEIGHVVFGQVIHTEPNDMYISRVAMINAGIPVETPALTVNRLCGSGVQAIISAAQSIMLGDCEVAIGGGAESMSRAPYHVPAMRWGARMGDSTMTDILLGTLNDPFNRYHMGITAENIAEKFHISREDQDAVALESNRRASAAIKAGYFKDQIVGIELKTRKGATVFDTDEHVRHDAKLEDMQTLKPAFKKDGGTVTAGNASGINDGAAAVVLAGGEAFRPEAVGALGRLRPCRRRSGLHGHRPGSGDQGGFGSRGAVGRSTRRHRIQRGVRRPGLCGHPRTRLRPGQGQPERQRYLAGPSGWCDRRDQHGEAGARTAAHRRPLRPRHHVHRRRPGHRRDLGTGVNDKNGRGRMVSPPARFSTLLRWNLPRVHVAMLVPGLKCSL
jgi:acetyl-CoA C-acetyltransferase